MKAVDRLKLAYVVMSLRYVFASKRFSTVAFVSSMYATLLAVRDGMIISSTLRARFIAGYKAAIRSTPRNLIASMASLFDVFSDPFRDEKAWVEDLI